MYTLICYSKCGTCRKAEKWLKDKNINYKYRPIDIENPTNNELDKWIQRSELSIQRWFNTSGKLYREQNIKDKIKELSQPELIDILSSNGMMVKRPILLTDEFVLVGFKEEEWEKLIN